MTLSESSAARISLLVDVARRQGSLISLRELLPLLNERTTEAELAEAFDTFPVLGSKFELKSGYVTAKSSAVREALLNKERGNRKVAARNLSYAAQFMPLIRSSPFRMVAVSGSTSYMSSSQSRDLDLFCVAPRGRMWFSLAQALLLARVFNLTRSAAPQLCLSCVMDQDYAESIFANEQDALFARDALASVVLMGRDTYGSLLRSASWIQSLYPGAYSLRSRQVSPTTAPQRWARSYELVLDRFLYVVVGSFIKMKAFILNRKLAGRQRREGVFRIRAGYDHLIYESARYAGLRAAYAAVRAE
ncbi:MAG: hypothetical protein OK438_07475 [Thaumarchaeota archaeon]|nr:hypothetical protein [Nitrososphaerota archaeon]